MLIEGGSIRDCCLTGVLCIDGGEIEARGVKVSGKGQLDGVAVCGYRSKGRLINCTIEDVVKIGVFATEGGYVELTGCTVSALHKLPALRVQTRTCYSQFREIWGELSPARRNPNCQLRNAQA